MRRRVAQLIGQSLADRMQISTFHGLCSLLLRRHGNMVSVPRDFLVLDDVDQKSLIRGIHTTLKADGKLLSGVDERVPVKAFRDAISRQKSWRAEQQRPLSESTCFLPMPWQDLEQVMQLYEAKKAAAGQLDYDDMLLKTAELLEQNPRLFCALLFLAQRVSLILC